MITVLCKSSTEKLPLNRDTSAFRQRIIIRNKAMSIYHKIPENSSLDVNGTHVLGAFYWKIIGNMVVPFTVWTLLQLKRVFHSSDWTRVHQLSILN